MGLVKSGANNLHIVSSNVGTAERGLGPLFQSKQVQKVCGAHRAASTVFLGGRRGPGPRYVGENDIFEQQFLQGDIEVDLVPMGTMAGRGVAMIPRRAPLCMFPRRA